MNAQPSHHLTASVLFVRPRGGLPWAPGEGLNDPVRLAAGRAVSQWALDRRIVLESADGIAIVGLGDPHEARAGAQRAAGDPLVSVGLDHGPVDLSTDEAGVTQGEGAAIERAAREAGAAPGGTAAESAAFTAAVDARSRRRWVLAAAIAGVLAIGGGTRLIRRRAAASRPAMIQLQIQPAGEVFVDGQPKGTSPPLVRLWVAPGPHSIEVRHPRFKPLKMDVQLQPGEELQVVHTFSNAPARRRSLLERLKFW